jgi:hypothetical protein
MDMQRIIRSGEQVLAQCSCTPAEETLRFGTGGSDISYLFITNARWIWMSSNNDGVVSVPWHWMRKVTLGRKRFKHTLAISFTREGWQLEMDYPAEYVSSAVAKTVEQIRSGVIPVYELPPEQTTAVKYFRPHDSSPLAQYARSQGIPEFALKCSICGKSAGLCSEDGDSLFSVCEGCERTFSGIENG